MNKPFTKEETQAWLDKLPKKGIGVKAIVRTPDGQILLLLPQRKGWQFPGGSVDDHEDPADTVVRELKEELDIDISKDDISVLDAIYRNDYDHIVLFYTVEATVPADIQFVLQTSEAKEYRFFTADEAKKLVTPVYLPVFDKLGQ